MRHPIIRPRPDQISELSRGLQLPLPEIQSNHLKIIAEGLSRAFSDLSSQAPAVVSAGIESEVTALMESRLNALIEEDPFWGQLVLCVVRGKESLSYDGSHLEKRPDLSIYLTDRNRGFPLIAEAKIIDSIASKTETLYCDNGIQRFIKGEYAWGSREAFMIAYVRDGSSISTKLIPFLSSAMSQTPPAYFVEELRVAIWSGNADVAYSRHGRSFVYTNKILPDLQPGPISVWHLWLPCM